MIAPFMHFRRATTAALVIASLSLVAACGDDDPTDPEPEPQVQTMTLTAGASSITIDKTTGAASGQLTVPAGTTTITASFKKADGSVESLVTGAEFDVRIRPATGTPFTWTPNTSLGGSLVTSGVTSGQTIASSVDLYHREEAHEDFGPYNFTIRIQ
jgi:hypothetical protein